MTVTNNIYQKQIKYHVWRIQCGYEFRVDRTCSGIYNTICVSYCRLKSKHIMQKCLTDMGTSITDVIGGPHDFLPPRSDRSDEFQKLCSYIKNIDTLKMLASCSYKRHNKQDEF